MGDAASMSCLSYRGPMEQALPDTRAR